MIVVGAGRACARSSRFRRRAVALHLRARLLRAARLDVFGQSVNEVRTELGPPAGARAPAYRPTSSCRCRTRACARRSATRRAGHPVRLGLIRNHYVGRTFIEPQQSIRHFGVQGEAEPGARASSTASASCSIDDSIVRGTTSRKIVKMVRAAGAREVHVRISCPPTISPCFYGIDTPRRSELIAATHSLEEIRAYIGADSLGYLSLEGLLSVGRGGAARTARPAIRASIPWPSRRTRARICSSPSSSMNSRAAAAGRDGAGGISRRLKDAA